MTDINETAKDIQIHTDGDNNIVVNGDNNNITISKNNDQGIEDAETIQILKNEKFTHPYLKDSFQNYETKNILYGNRPLNKYYKCILTTAIKSYSIVNLKNKLDNNEWTQFYDDLYNRHSDYSYDLLVKILSDDQGLVTTEYIVASALYAYRSHRIELIIRIANVFGRPVKLDSGKDSWIDNYRENALGYSLSFIFREKYDCLEVVSNKISTDRNNENNNRHISFSVPSKIVTYDEIYNYVNGDVASLRIVGIFKLFLIFNR